MELKITNRKGVLFTVFYDQEDNEMVSKRVWRIQSVNGTSFYAVSGNTRTGTLVIMHRAIAGVVDPKIFVDHENGNGLDNRRENLRPCSHLENMRNRQVNRNSKTGFKGVWIINGRYKCGIRFNGKTFHLGTFKTAIDAAKAYDAKAKELHGGFAKLNFK